MSTTPRALRAARRGFSIVEMLIALTISSLLMTACLVALDASFKSYQATTDSASTHVVSRLVMTRLLAMIRQGDEFGPYPYGIVTPTRLDSDYIEFVSFKDDSTGERQVTRIAKVPDPQAPSTFQLQYTRWDYLNGVQTGTFSYPLIRSLENAQFTLEYDIGPRLLRATVDLTIKPNDVSTSATTIQTELQSPVLRLVASATPRKLDE